MLYGYTLLDPLVVLCGTFLTIYYLQRNTLRLIGYLPAAFSLWFFVPTITNLTLWQVVPLLLIVRFFLKGQIHIPYRVQSVFIILSVILSLSLIFALIAGDDAIRAIIRFIYYLGAFAIFSFAYEMGRKPEAYNVLLKGLVIVGFIYSIYGVYQIIAYYSGLPLRGIVYTASGESVMAFEGGLLRINSLANEPKRLGYVLFLSAIACFFLARASQGFRQARLRFSAVFIFAVSTLTFAGSYYLAILLFLAIVILVYPSKATVFSFIFLLVITFIFIAFPHISIVETIKHGFDRRMNEIEVGLDGVIVYRQEIFAWDYLDKNPLAYLTGVGIGQYYSVLNSAYGPGAGFNENGALMPLNSNFLEMVFDLGIFFTIIIYGGLSMLIVKLRYANENFFCVSIIFLVAQSFSILNLLFLVLFAGAAMGRLSSYKLNFIGYKSKPNSIVNIVRT